MSVAGRVGGKQPATAVSTVAWESGRKQVRDDVVAVEEPLEIRLAGMSVAVTMRTPGDDLDLAVGFLYTEGIVREADDLADIAYCDTDDVESAGNIVNVNPRDPTTVDPDRWQRHFFVTSSCGICGSASIDTVRKGAPSISSHARVDAEVLSTLDHELRRAQAVFEQTGGLHAAALFDKEGRLLVMREDVGRHNAVDKIVGAMVRQNALPLHDRILLVSSRASFEIVQKALIAGIPVVAAVSAASSLAVELARASNMTLVGFLRSSADGRSRFNVYAGEERIVWSGRER